MHTPTSDRWTTNPPTIAGTGIGPLHGASLAEAEFLRLPKPRTRCPISSLSRTTLVELADQGLVKSICLRKKGATRGIRLIEKSSLLTYLHSLSEVGEGGAS